MLLYFLIILFLNINLSHLRNIYYMTFCAGFVKIGGYEALRYRYNHAIPVIRDNSTSCGIPRDDAWHMFRHPTNSDNPWPGLLLQSSIGCLWYWCADQVLTYSFKFTAKLVVTKWSWNALTSFPWTNWTSIPTLACHGTTVLNQGKNSCGNATINSTVLFCKVIVQRALAAKNLSHAKGGAILAGYLKLLPIFLMIFPGMISRALYPGIQKLTHTYINVFCDW